MQNNSENFRRKTNYLPVVSLRTRKTRHVSAFLCFVLFSSVDTASTRRSSRVLGGHAELPTVVGSASSVGTSSAAARRHRDSVISAILRQEIERRKSLKEAADGTCAEKLTPAAALAAAAAAFELPGIHISRIETMDLEDDETLGSR
jgi:hypothetical protein